MAIGILHVSAERLWLKAYQMSNAQFPGSMTRPDIREKQAFGFSPEINLIDTVAKQATARLHLFKVE
jgi:hypothetical protein